MADKKDKIQEISELIGEAIILSVSQAGPESGQGDLTEEEKAKIKQRVGDAFGKFLEHSKWKSRTDPLIDKFKDEYLPVAVKLKLSDGNIIEEAIKEAFPGLEDVELEAHAVLNLIANITCVGPFRKIKDEILAKIVEETYTLAGLTIAYLAWRQKSTTPPKGDQH